MTIRDARVQHALELVLNLLLPLGAAALIGWLAKMVGRRGADGVLFASLVLVAVVAHWLLRARAEKQLARDDGAWRQRLAAIGVALALVVGAGWISAPAPLTSLNQEALRLSFARDAKLIHAHGQALNAAMARLKLEGLPPPDDAALTARQEKVLVDTWRSLLDYTLALEGLRRFYEDYYRFDLASHRADHVTAFLLTYAADATLQDVGGRFSELIATNSNARKLLDAERGGMRKDSFSAFRQKLISYDEQFRFEAGKRYLSVVNKLPISDNQRPLAAKLRGILKRRIERVAKLGIGDRADASTRAELQSFKRHAIALWYPLQKGVAEVMGDTRVRRIGHYLIDKPTRDKVRAKLVPGDVLLSRKNWYLSNVGLPGFWPHALIYLGTPDELSAFYEDDAVHAWTTAEAGHPIEFGRYLQNRFPNAWKSYTTEHPPHHPGEEAEPPVVIEAISEGVSFSTLGEAAGDYLVGLRPRLSKLDRAKALVRALSHFGKPYDFDFDFATDDALVCTELVHRAYSATADSNGLNLTLRTMAGRSTLPANDIAAQFAAERGRPDAQFDFVVFVDGREADNSAFISTEDAFALTHKRAKWDIVQQ